MLALDTSASLDQRQRPRPFIALEGDTDTISLPDVVRQSMLGARPAYALLDAPDRLGVNFAHHGHAFTPDGLEGDDGFLRQALPWQADRSPSRSPGSFDELEDDQG